MEEPHTLVNSAMQQQQQPSVEQEKITEKHDLSDEWCFWAHLPHDTDWSLNSYKIIYNQALKRSLLLVDDLGCEDSGSSLNSHYIDTRGDI